MNTTQQPQNPSMPSLPFVMQTPRQRFKESQSNLADHRRMVESDAFERAADYALMEYTMILGRTPEGLAAAAHFKSVGAQEFLLILKTLAETPQIPRGTAPASLNHDA